MLIPLKSTSPMLVMMRNMAVPICNRLKGSYTSIVW